MRKFLNMVLLAVSLIVAQACGSKSTENNDMSSTHEDSVANQTEAKNAEIKLTLAEKRVLIDKQTAAREERRRLEFEERIKTSPTYVNSDGKMIYNKAEVDPSFVGGKKAMMKYLSDNIQFPEDAQKEELEGTVFVDFVITEAGDVREVGVTDAPGEEVDQRFRDEAIRVVSSMPKWVPGKQHGKPVQVKYSLPIAFQIQ
ncbi:MAG: energy transducer TonB [Chryseolinea sp.]